MTRICVAVLLLATCAPTLLWAEETPDEFFERKIRPVLVQHCYRCHSADGDSLKANLFLDSRDGMRRGGDSGPAVVPGDLKKSLLIDALRYESIEMPPSGKLPENVIADFVTWVEMGAPDPRKDGPAAAAMPVTASTIDWTTAREFWSFRKPEAHPQPRVSAPDWVSRPLDGFILEKLDRAGLKPAEEADRRMLIRRVTFDLTGLSPTPADVDAFVADDSPEAYENVVDRLLAAPQYGERWARLWLDIARYAEDQAHIVGSNRELCYPNAYRYRDWVIAALNSDLPYDEFIRRQLAADLIAPDDQESHVALGFIGLGPKYYRRGSPEVMAEEWEDRVDTVTRGLLGLTVACARCHHHKYDPIPTEDYYALAGVFASTEMFNRPLTEAAETTKGGQSKKADEALHIVRDLKPHDIEVMIRGDVSKKGPKVERHFLTALSNDVPSPLQNGSGRLDLAKAIASRENPLTARVIVNRVWAQFFKTVLVKTMSNFGALGDAPTHPELLDDIAVRFMDNGWSLKWLVREIALSSTYRQSSHAAPESLQADPENRLLSRMPRRRLSVEAWRDAVMAASGELDPSVYGVSIDPMNVEARRRTVYAEISRLELNKLLALFDFPDPNTHNPQRNATTTPLQKLFVLNNPFMLRHAEKLRDRVAVQAGDDAPLRVVLAYRLVFGRMPTADEQQLASEFLGDMPSAERWTEYTHALLASNEFLILD
ncbi:Planctomycete cytochrome C [Caulifigura coniformis]|uniref:Planctomycete cytochrome C n=1 Tax=Caulifigura coniformis TaxID=2527983 RepID=A0A517SHD5_9PLAN|nr:PSD1 and planctomycete cytochrome C domain-containing protein [Caulifigura coniformis]QDT55525.1 Planctomycete cytochrome C [Caulifigura coniformis]